MTTSIPRRRVLRPRMASAPDPQSAARVQRWRSQLLKDRQALKRWMTRLKRAFTAIERLQASVHRLERNLNGSA